MKKIYFLLAGLTATGSLLSQVTLTKAFNGFTVGDNIITAFYDSTTVIPKTTGTNKVWNFTSMTANSQTSTVTYTNSAAGAGSSNFPSATLAEIKGGTETGYYNTSGANLEFLGFYDTNGPSVISVTNSAVMAAWPISYGSTNSDPFSGSVSSGTMQVPLTGVVSYTAAGTGTVILPGNTTYNNCLQVIRTLSVNLPSGPMLETTYSFYTPAFKFPIVEFVYNIEQGNTDFEFRVLTSAITGLTKNTLNNIDLNVFPNPASAELNINSNLPVEHGYISDVFGKTRMKFENNSVNVSQLEPGVYTITLKFRDGIASRKFVKH